jgi:hypothetical protein
MSQLRNLLRDAHLSERYDRTPRTINNWKRKKILPPADLTIAGRDYWYPETIEANERERFSAQASGEATRPARKSRTGIEPRAGVEA